MLRFAGLMNPPIDTMFSIKNIFFALSILASPLASAGCPMTIPTEPLSQDLELKFASKLTQKSAATEYRPEYSNWKERIKNVWHSPYMFAMIPVNTYHSRSTYTREQIDDYNEMPWGFGMGKWYRDERNVRHELYAVAFADSHSKVQPIVGYSWLQDIFFDSNNRFGVSYGCAFFITARQDYWYVPFPGLTPQVGIRLYDVEINVSWVPWLGPTYGNVFLTNVRYYF